MKPFSHQQILLLRALPILGAINTGKLSICILIHNTQPPPLVTMHFVDQVHLHFTEWHRAQVGDPGDHTAARSRVRRKWAGPGMEQPVAPTVPHSPANSRPTFSRQCAACTFQPSSGRSAAVKRTNASSAGARTSRQRRGRALADGLRPRAPRDPAEGGTAFTQAYLD